MTRTKRDGTWSLTDAVDDLLAALAPPGAGNGTSSRVVGGVFSQWEEAVGATIAAHARPVQLTAGRLLVEVDEPGWATQLRYLETELLARLETAAGPGVDAIELRVARR